MTPDEIKALVARLRGWDHCWPAPWLEGAVVQAVDALEAVQAEIARLTAERDEWREAAGAHHVASMREAEKWIIVSADRDELREELAKTLIANGELKIALDKAEARVVEQGREIAHLRDEVNER